MSSLIVHHTWPIVLAVFAGGSLFIAAWPRLYFRWLARWDSETGAADKLDAVPETAPPGPSLPQPTAPQQPALHQAAP